MEQHVENVCMQLRGIRILKEKAPNRVNQGKSYDETLAYLNFALLNLLHRNNIIKALRRDVPLRTIGHFSVSHSLALLLRQRLALHQTKRTDGRKHLHP
jgi:hypothetical protein